LQKEWARERQREWIRLGRLYELFLFLWRKNRKVKTDDDVDAVLQ
jgi:hypothetical protein